MIRVGSISGPSPEMYSEMLTIQADTLLTVLLIVTITMMGTNTVETIFILSAMMSSVVGIIITEAHKH